MSNIPYTHWSYFPDEASARRCAQDLADFVTRVREPLSDSTDWLLLAGRDVSIDHLVARHGEVAEIVERHGGKYDGGEAAYLGTGRPVADRMLFEDDGGATA